MQTRVGISWCTLDLTQDNSPVVKKRSKLLRVCVEHGVRITDGIWPEQIFCHHVQKFGQILRCSRARAYLFPIDTYSSFLTDVA
jgi:hypothetical protein